MREPRRRCAPDAGPETRRLIASPSRLHAVAREILASSTSRSGTPPSWSARSPGPSASCWRSPRRWAGGPGLLLLDEPTASLWTRRVGAGGGADHAPGRPWHHDRPRPRVTSSRCSGSRDGSSCCGTAGGGRDRRPTTSHPDDVAALLSGSAGRPQRARQLTRLHGLADRLVSADRPPAWPRSSPRSPPRSPASACASTSARSDRSSVRRSLGSTADEIESGPAGARGRCRWHGRAARWPTGSGSIDADVWSVAGRRARMTSGAAITVFRDPPGPPNATSSTC